MTIKKKKNVDHKDDAKEKEKEEKHLQRNDLASILLAHPLHRKICSLHHPHLKNISVQYPILTKFIPMFGFVGFCLFVSFVVLFSHNVDIQALSPSRGMVYPSVVAED